MKVTKKVTNDDLLKLFGVQVGSQIKFDGEVHEVVLIKPTFRENDDVLIVRSMKERSKSLRLECLINVDYEIIRKVRLSYQERILLNLLDKKYEYILRNLSGKLLLKSVDDVVLFPYTEMFDFVVSGDDPMNIQEIKNADS